MVAMVTQKTHATCLAGLLARTRVGAVGCSNRNWLPSAGCPQGAAAVPPLPWQQPDAPLTRHPARPHAHPRPPPLPRRMCTGTMTKEADEFDEFDLEPLVEEW
jgi:hypothetical protein